MLVAGAWGLKFDPYHPQKKLGMLVHAFNPRTEETEAGGALELAVQAV